MKRKTWKNMLKKGMAVLLSAVIVLGVLPGAAPADISVAAGPAVVLEGSYGSNLSYRLTDDGVLTLSGTGAMEDISVLKRPFHEKRNEITKVIIEPGITSIGSNAFRGCTSLTEVEIADTVTSIGQSAFYTCAKLTGITIPDNVTVIGNGAFDQCAMLSEVKLSEHLTSVGGYVFRGCNIGSVEIPDGLTEIGGEMFADNKNLVSVKLPDSVTVIGQSAFRNTALETLVLPADLTTIGLQAFRSCYRLQYLVLPSGVREIGVNAFYEDSGAVIYYPAALSAENVEKLKGRNSAKAIVEYNVYSDFNNNLVTDLNVIPNRTMDAIHLLNHVSNAEVVSSNYMELNGIAVTHDGACISSNTIKYDSENHWRPCPICGKETDLSSHSYSKWIVDRPATETEAGEKHRGCGECGYVEKAVIPVPTDKPGDNDQPGDNEDNPGEIDRKLEAGENAPAVSTIMSAQELAEAILTEAEMQEVAAGTDITIRLTVEDADSTVSEEEKAIINTVMTRTLDGYQMGQYLDINLFKIIGVKQDKITQTTRAIRITLDVPDRLKNTDGTRMREFSIVRVHNGEAAVLKDLDTDADTITIDTNCFSTYAIVYRDTTGEENTGNTNTENNSTENNSTETGNTESNGNTNGNNSESTQSNANTQSSASGQKDKEPKTGKKGIPVELFATTAMIAGLSYLLLYVTDRRNGMTEEEKRLLLGSIIRWAHRGSVVRILPALAAIVLLLAYYHSIGKAVSVEWKEVYGK